MFKDHENKVWCNLEEMCKYYNRPLGTFCYRYYQKGWNLKDALLVPEYKSERNSVTDHLGNKFYSATEMCLFWNVSQTAYYERIGRHGMSIEKALTTPYKSRIITDPEGNTFLNTVDMCIYHNMSDDLFKTRLRRGWTFEDALYKPIKPMKGRISIDHLGIEYPSFSSMCRAYNVARGVVQYRLKHNYTLKDALEIPTRRSWKSDFLNKYPDKANILDNLPVTELTIRSRLKQNWNLYKAVTTPASLNNKKSSNSVKIGNTFVVYDHENRQFNSVKDMCEYWGITTAMYHIRRKKGWSLEKILITPSRVKDRYNVRDHENTLFDTLDDMCNFYHIPVTTYQYRKNKGWSTKQALLTPKRQKPIEDNN